MIIREVRPGDMADLALIFHHAVQIGSAAHYTQPQRDGWSDCVPSTAGWARRLEGLLTLVAERDGIILGYMSAEPDSGLIDLAFVAPEHIGTGVAHALYRVLEPRLAALGRRRLTVDGSEDSLRFFTRQGFHVTGRIWHDTGAAAVHNWLMAKDL